MSLLKVVSKIYTFNRSMGYKSNRCKYWLERVGDREMVGFGMNGTPMYTDRSDFPFSAIRYKETTPQLQALYEKQKGDWKLLSKEEKKTLYRANFCQTFSEFQAPTGEWMEIVGYGLMFCCLGAWLYLSVRVMHNFDTPDTFLASNVRAQLRRMIDIQADPIQGLCSNWDYEKRNWKRISWNTPPNPFIKCPDD